MILATLLTAGFGTAVGAGLGAEQDIRLVLQITVDGLRGDLLNRYWHGFGEGGFRYLTDTGVVYANAHYQHSNTETVVGHSTLATGAFPSQHGMVGNVWFDREAGELAYNIEDPDHPLLPTREAPVVGDQLDPAQKLSRTQGRSPAAILAATLGDVLAAFYGGRAKVFGVSGKDRGAVPMAGHAGKAFWISTNTGDFVTSAFYYDEYPAWVQDWNSLRKAEGYAGTTWELLGEKTTYIMGHRDDRPYETDLKGFGRVFPHRYGEVDDRLLFTQVLVSPAGDKLTLDFARTLLRNEGLGQDDVPDYLSVSFSGVDAVNHIFGPSSLENEDVVRHLDRTIADLIDFIDETVGMEHTLVVLAADHGMADMPEYMSELGLNAGRIYPEDVVSIANDAGREHFDIDGIARFFFRPYLYLDDAKIVEAELEKGDVGHVIAEALTRVEGIALALARNRGLPSEAMPIHAQVLRNFHTSRSGDVYVVQDPYWFLYERGPVAAMHGSPWRYDTHVPIIFAHPGIRSQTVYRSVHPVDVAPTIAAILGIAPPSSSQGEPLQEVAQ